MAQNNRCEALRTCHLGIPITTTWCCDQDVKVMPGATFTKSTCDWFIAKRRGCCWTVHCKKMLQPEVDMDNQSRLRKDSAFLFRHGFGSGVKNLWKSGPWPESFFIFGVSRSLDGRFLRQSIGNFWLDRWWSECEQKSDSESCKICGPGLGFKTFGTGAESESEKMTPATCGCNLSVGVALKGAR